MELEEQVMGIIINAGQSRSLCYEALGCAKRGDFEAADERMKEATHYAREAHLVQTQLIEADEGEENQNDAGDGSRPGSPDDVHSGQRVGD
jgi:PTS system cellobiose-specific IIA component